MYDSATKRHAGGAVVTHECFTSITSRFSGWGGGRGQIGKWHLSPWWLSQRFSHFLNRTGSAVSSKSRPENLLACVSPRNLSESPFKPTPLGTGLRQTWNVTDWNFSDSMMKSTCRGWWHSRNSSYLADHCMGQRQKCTAWRMQWASFEIQVVSKLCSNNWHNEQSCFLAIISSMEPISTFLTLYCRPLFPNIWRWKSIPEQISHNLTLTIAV